MKNIYPPHGFGPETVLEHWNPEALGISGLFGRWTPLEHQTSPLPRSWSNENVLSSLASSRSGAGGEGVPAVSSQVTSFCECIERDRHVWQMASEYAREFLETLNEESHLDSSK